MRLLSVIVTVTTLLIVQPSFAHGDGHGHQPTLSADGAISVAVKAAKKMSFKDMGLAIGKLDTSWGKINPENFKVVERNAMGYIIVATNDDTETLVFSVSKEGRLIDVVNRQTFEKSHGHSH
ncbi:hypothetical protein SOPP22_17285 [Shewanella sp. OPT22]|nr:hypothetical protein SOPP22_17285 [Shewanella sp. OPT22]